MPVAKTVHLKRAMLSTEHSRCLHPHTLPPRLQKPGIADTRVDLAKLSVLIIDLTLKLDLLEFEVCNLNYKINAVIDGLQQQQAQSASSDVEGLGIAGLLLI